MKDSLESVSFCYVPWELNRAADCLAKWAFERMDGWNVGDWGQLPPDYAQSLEMIVREDRMN